MLFRSHGAVLAVAAMQGDEAAGKAFAPQLAQVALCGVERVGVHAGELAKEIIKDINKDIYTKSFEDNESLEKFMSGYLKAGDVCLLKGSNSMRLFDVVDKIKNHEKFIR